MKAILDFLKSNKIIVYFAFFALFLAFSYISGCVHGRKTKVCPTITQSVIIKHDTVTRTIKDSYPEYITRTDTIIFTQLFPQEVDTAFILKDYFATHVYNRFWQDSLLRVDLTDYITQNKSIKNIFKYNILRPSQIITNTIDNSVTYNSYLTLGFGLPIKDITYINLNANYNWSKGYLGVQYMPKIKSFGVNLGATLFKFKQKK